MGRLRFCLAMAICCSTGFTYAQDTMRTSWGDPDLRGTYTSDNWIGVPFQRAERYGTSEQISAEEHEERISANDVQVAKDRAPEPESKFSTDDPASLNAPRHWLERAESPVQANSMIVDPPNGRLPAMTDEGERLSAGRRGQRRRPPLSYTDFSNYNRCITRGLTGSILPVIYGNGTEIFQAPGYVVIRSEMIHEARLIPLDDTPHAGEAIRMWMGDSRGRFEGDTLVVETTNFMGGAGIGSNGGGAAYSEDVRLVERIRRISQDMIHYEFTVHDPAVYTAPWTARVELYAKPGYKIYEYACHEGNYGLANMLNTARTDERRANDR